MTKKQMIAKLQQDAEKEFLPKIAEAEAKTKLNFANEEDREYWIEKVNELKIKLATAKNNAVYMVKMAVYDR